MPEIVFVVAGLLLILLVYGYASNFFLKNEYYEVSSPKIKRPAKAVFLTDLHCNKFGKNNQRLLDRIAKEHPDFVLVTGDMTVKNGKDIQGPLSLMGKLTKSYAVYYSPGNHEIRMPNYEDYKRELRQLGVFYLENQRATEKKTGMVVAGLDLPEDYYHKFWRKVDFSPEIMGGILPVPKEEDFTLLLAHNPEYLPVYGRWGADLSLSGHLHGGIAILPVLGGVLSPSLRLFPKYDQGYFVEGGCRGIVSRGLGLHHIKFRFFNLPELSVINFTCKEDEK
ncbi:MAG: metallophosphoesterase [Eubacterium sp.]|nr:metallophosphoesterase [Eubacterium sp.]